MKSAKQSIAYFLLLFISVIMITGDISCVGRSDKNEKQSDDSTANNTNPKVSDKDISAKTGEQDSGAPASRGKQVKQLTATQNTRQNANNTGNATNQVLTQAHTAVAILNSQTFDETIKSGVTLVDFWAVWCRPCRMEAPIVEEVNTVMAGRAKVCKMEIDNNKMIADRFNIQYIPTLIIFKDGRIVKQFTGFTSKDDILGALINQLK